jgi:hypothetical protein
LEHIGLPERIYLDRSNEQRLHKKGFASGSIRGSSAVFYWLANGALKEKLRDGKLTKEQYRQQHMRLRRSLMNRHPVIMRAGEVKSPVFAHDYVGPVEARGALGWLWFRKKPPVDSEPMHVIEEDGRRMAVNRTHWALFKNPFQEHHIIVYPATAGHGPKIRDRTDAHRFEEVETRDLLEVDMPEFIEYGRRYLSRDQGKSMRMPFTTESARRVALQRAHAALDRLGEEVGELPTWAQRVHELRTWTPLGRTHATKELPRMLRL